MTSAIDALVGARIRWLRCRRGTTVAELAASAAVAPERMARFESGVEHVPIDVLQVIATALGVDVEDLFAQSDGLPVEQGDDAGLLELRPPDAAVDPLDLARRHLEAALALLSVAEEAAAASSAAKALDDVLQAEARRRRSGSLKD
ncbi:MAG TPA: helix-turn-helix domain-containing protein [Hyphomicrobiales bacterium]|nr:helix-turn-helix domain-containing protein [Hyphomicrobiales bacterium]